MRLSWVGVVRPPSQAKRAYAEEPNIMMRWHVRSATWAAHPPGNAAGEYCKIRQVQVLDAVSYFLGEFRYLRPIMFSVVAVPASHCDLCELPDAAAAPAASPRSLPSFQVFVGIKVSSVSFSRTQVRSPSPHRLLFPSFASPMR